MWLNSSDPYRRSSELAGEAGADTGGDRARSGMPRVPVKNVFMFDIAASEIPFRPPRGSLSFSRTTTGTAMRGIVSMQTIRHVAQIPVIRARHMMAGIVGSRDASRGTDVAVPVPGGAPWTGPDRAWA